jgi:hypothetical protein
MAGGFITIDTMASWSRSLFGRWESRVEEKLRRYMDARNEEAARKEDKNASKQALILENRRAQQAAERRWA